MLRNMGLNVINPFERDKNLNYKTIVRRDLRLIKKSDILIAYLPYPSIGTSMEIIFAKMNNLTVYIIAGKEIIKHPWLLYYGDKIFRNFEELIHYLKPK